MSTAPAPPTGDDAAARWAHSVFHGGAALDRGLVSRRGLRRHYTRIYPDTYLHNDIEVDTRVRAESSSCAA
ncbi:hypothetical protein [Rhodococcus sp. W8901]|uniref:hypothetical protein n=1 Tax=Rhodococcus sp. W8901 TaxID=2742603 RepID=UPI0015815270|nr:hypothetical protein [Rhodococcus sp. W8901]QKT13183.1 hypothetical protein HUN07_22825 [Rhodococcus sp. W8901]